VERVGLVVRRPDPKGRRGKLIVLTRQAPDRRGNRPGTLRTRSGSYCR
jgi:hypothetical protein